MNKIFLAIVFVACFILPLNGQTSKVTLVMKELAQSRISYVHTDSLNINTYLDSVITAFKFRGHLYAVIDTFYCKNDSCFALLYKGDQFKFKEIRIPKHNKELLGDYDLLTYHMADNPPDSAQVNLLLRGIALNMANSGFPFAKVFLDSVEFEGEYIKAALNIQKGPQILFDTLVLEGKLSLNRSFISKYLNIKPADLYQHNLVRGITNKLNSLVYLRQNKQPSVLFDNQYAKVVLDLDPAPSSKLDFILGILPSQTGGGNSFLITGDFTAEMYNLLGAGEYSYFQFKRLRPSVSELQMKSSLPYLYRLPFGSHLDFRIFKNGNQNLDLFFDGGIQYLYGGANQFKVYYSHRSSAVIEVDTFRMKLNRKLPQGLDVTYSGLGGGFFYRNTDNLYNPTRGFLIQINASAGYRKILPNRLITDISGFESAYDSISLRSVQAELISQIAYHFPFGKRLIFKSAINAGFKQNENGLLSNELLRVGGSKLMRGFDEESIFTDGYFIFTGELRLLLDRLSYLSFPFIDLARVSTREYNGYATKNLIGIGFGLNFNTKVGIFNLAIASGQTKIDWPGFGNARVHFGFQNLF